MPPRIPGLASDRSEFRVKLACRQLAIVSYGLDSTDKLPYSELAPCSVGRKETVAPADELTDQRVVSCVLLTHLRES